MILDVDRHDFRTTRIGAVSDAPLQPGEVRFAVERFAITTNNITYAVAGDMLDYWGFFPAEAPWGHIPAIGLATIVESANPAVPVGGRWFGFYPMATEHVALVEPRGTGGMRDIGAHRAGHAATYTDFRDISNDPTFDVDHVDVYLLVYGMFMTSFLVDDQLGERDFAGARATIVTSASSKTSISLASCLARRDDITAIGLTSARNRAFVESLGLYDRVATYDEVATLDAAVATGVVDMAGNAEVISAVHHHFADSLAFSVSVGVTHWEDREGDATPLPGPAPEFFFAPAQMAKRVQEWGADEVQRRIEAAYAAVVRHSSTWLQVQHHVGPEATDAAYRALLEGAADPATGAICTMGTDMMDADPIETQEPA